MLKVKLRAWLTLDLHAVNLKAKLSWLVNIGLLVDCEDLWST